MQAKELGHLENGSEQRILGHEVAAFRSGWILSMDLITNMRSPLCVFQSTHL
jgi:hypothetical protein